MNRDRPSLRQRSLGIVIALVWLLASFAAAALAHALIGILGDAGAAGAAYAEHAHAAVGPVALAALGLIAGLLFRSALHRISGTGSDDAAIWLARRFGSMDPTLPSLAVAAGALATLLGMEFTEQLAAFGSVAGVNDALGGNAVAGLSVVACVSTVLTALGLRCARGMLVSVAATAGALYAWMLKRAEPRVDASASAGRTRMGRIRLASTTRPRCRGLRAPPAAFE